MADFTHRTFVGEEIDLDGNTFTGCVFRRCIIRFSARATVSMSDCKFHDCTLTVGGPAALTLDYLRAVYHGLGEWGRKSVERLFEEVRQPEVRQPKKVDEGKT